ncbi:hypothetical protein GCM10022295_22670 [Streptomyces osmaniensis]|uniref:Uncharacterized protein n=1 Tax=Streptomyces osmaniensis TaxID=593134 RepID=A0ABP6VUP3_9ACTN
MAPTCIFRLHDDTGSAWECRFRLWFTARHTATSAVPISSWETIGTLLITGRHHVRREDAPPEVVIRARTRTRLRPHRQVASNRLTYPHDRPPGLWRRGRNWRMWRRRKGALFLTAGQERGKRKADNTSCDNAD